MATCTVTDCKGRVKGRGLCGRHYESARAAGEFLEDARRVEEPKRTVAIRFGASERAEVEAAATRAGLPTATWIRLAALKAARRK